MYCYLNIIEYVIFNCYFLGIAGIKNIDSTHQVVPETTNDFTEGQEAEENQNDTPNLVPDNTSANTPSLSFDDLTDSLRWSLHFSLYWFYVFKKLVVLIHWYYFRQFNLHEEELPTDQDDDSPTSGDTWVKKFLKEHY